MAYEHKDMTGSLWPNQYKKKDNHPDLKGQAMVDGVLYDVAAWKKKTANDKVFLSLSISKPYVKPESSVNTQVQQGDEDDMPF